jgi:hypothetical protein
VAEASASGPPHADSASAVKTAAAGMSAFFLAVKLRGNRMHFIGNIPIPGQKGAGGAYIKDYHNDNRETDKYLYGPVR